jgi:hypothetical protein
MTLTNVALPFADQELPSKVLDFIAEANHQVTKFMEARHKPLVGFYPSCFETVYRALREISTRRLTAGNGIEIDSELCDISRELAKQFNIPVHFVTGSFIPPGSDRLIDRAYANFQGDLMLDPHTDNTYDEIGMEVCDFDLIFAYPWPKDAKLTGSLFDKFASSDALLLTYNGLESVRLQRKRR